MKKIFNLTPSYTYERESYKRKIIVYTLSITVHKDNMRRVYIIGKFENKTQNPSTLLKVLVLGIIKNFNYL